MYEKIYCVNHVGSNLLIVAFEKINQWQFRAVNKEGEIVKEEYNFLTAEIAKEVGENWIKENLII